MSIFAVECYDELSLIHSGQQLDEQMFLHGIEISVVHVTLASTETQWRAIDYIACDTIYITELGNLICSPGAFSVISKLRKIDFSLIGSSDGTILEKIVALVNRLNMSVISLN